MLRPAESSLWQTSRHEEIADRARAEGMAYYSDDQSPTQTSFTTSLALRDETSRGPDWICGDSKQLLSDQVGRMPL